MSDMPRRERVARIESLLQDTMGRAFAIAPPLTPQLSWGQATWFIDPLNVSGTASDGNHGATASSPLRTYGALARRWGTVSPILSQTTTVTFLSNCLTEPVVAFPMMRAGASLIFTGANKVLGSGVLGGVVAKNRATPQLLEATLGASATPFVGNLIVNTSKGNSVALVYQDLGGGAAVLTQPFQPANPAILMNVAAGSFPNDEVDSWANGDNFQILQLIDVNFVYLDCILSEDNATFSNGVIVYRAAVSDPNAPGTDNLEIGENVSFGETRTDRLIVGVGGATPLYNNVFNNVWCAGGFSGPCSKHNGGAVDIVTDFSNVNILDGDIILGNGYFAGDLRGDPTLGLVYLATGYTLLIQSASAQGFQNTPPAHPCILWGPGNMQLDGKGILTYTDTAANFFQQKGTMKINGSSNAFGFDVTNATWHGPITITPAHLDGTIAGGGFAGAAIFPPTGGVITNSPWI